MTDKTVEELEAEYDAARDAFEAKNRELSAEFRRQKAPAVRDHDVFVAIAQSEYDRKVSEAKAELTATTRRVKGQLSDFRLEREARIRAEDRKLEGLIAPFRLAKNRTLAPLRSAKDEAWERYRAKKWPPG